MVFQITEFMLSRIWASGETLPIKKLLIKLAIDAIKSVHWGCLIFTVGAQSLYCHFLHIGDWNVVQTCIQSPHKKCRTHCNEAAIRFPFLVCQI